MSGWLEVHRLFTWSRCSKHKSYPGHHHHQDLTNFQMAPMPILCNLLCWTSSPHDNLKVLRTKIDHNTGPLGVSNLTLVYMVGFWLVLLPQYYWADVANKLLFWWLSIINILILLYITTSQLKWQSLHMWVWMWHCPRYLNALICMLFWPIFTRARVHAYITFEVCKVVLMHGCNICMSSFVISLHHWVNHWGY